MRTFSLFSLNIEKLSLFKKEGIEVKKSFFGVYSLTRYEYLSVRRDCLYFFVIVEGITMNTGFMEMKKPAPCLVLTPEFGIQSS